MKYLFTGTGRCGTAYLARYLTAAGLPTAHECLLQAFRDVQPWEWDGIEREVSWLGQFWLPRVPPEVEIIHVIRDPRKVYDSFMSRGYFDELCTDTAQPRAWYQGCMKVIDEQTFSPKLSPSERCERWIVGTHSRLVNYPRIYIDKGDLHFGLETLLKTKLTRREVPYTNAGSGETHERPAYIMKLAEELGYV